MQKSCNNIPGHAVIHILLGCMILQRKTNKIQAVYKATEIQAIMQHKLAGKKLTTDCIH